MFAFKKIVSLFFFPVALLGFLFLAGIALSWWKNAPALQRWGRRILTLAVILFFILGSDPAGQAALRPLTNRYERLEVGSVRKERGVDWRPEILVVLAAGHEPDARLPPASRLSGRSLARLTEARRLANEFPESRLIVTGGRIDPRFHPIAEDMAAVLRQWGIAEGRIFTETESRDTKDHVRFLREDLAGTEFVLITSASHMPRAMALFRHAGLDPVAAPVAGTKSSRLHLRRLWRAWIPKAGNFAKVEAAAYEYMGLLWAKLRGQI